MTDLFRLILGILASLVKRRAELEAENLVLRRRSSSASFSHRTRAPSLRNWRTSNTQSIFRERSHVVYVFFYVRGDAIEKPFYVGETYSLTVRMIKNSINHTDKGNSPAEPEIARLKWLLCDRRASSLGHLFRVNSVIGGDKSFRYGLRQTNRTPPMSFYP
jgi:hypothetical protein